MLAPKELVRHLVFCVLFLFDPFTVISYLSKCNSLLVLHIYLYFLYLKKNVQRNIQYHVILSHMINTLIQTSCHEVWSRDSWSHGQWLFRFPRSVKTFRNSLSVSLAAAFPNMSVFRTAIFLTVLVLHDGHSWPTKLQQSKSA